MDRGAHVKECTTEACEHAVTHARVDELRQPAPRKRSLLEYGGECHGDRVGVRLSLWERGRDGRDNASAKE